MPIFVEISSNPNSRKRLFKKWKVNRAPWLFSSLFTKHFVPWIFNSAGVEISDP